MCLVPVKLDIYVSIHFNESINKARHGYQVYVPYITKYPLRSYALASGLHYEISHTIPSEFTAGKFSNVNILDEGIRASRFNVLIKSCCPAVLFELGYYPTPKKDIKLVRNRIKRLWLLLFPIGIRRYFERPR